MSSVLKNTIILVTSTGNGVEVPLVDKHDDQVD